MSTGFEAPCSICGYVAWLRTISGGLAGDGMCERCDEACFRSMNPRAVWDPWSVKRARYNARKARQSVKADHATIKAALQAMGPERRELVGVGK